MFIRHLFDCYFRISLICKLNKQTNEEHIKGDNRDHSFGPFRDRIERILNHPKPSNSNSNKRNCESIKY